ncbi:MAG: hypothetical protein EDM03_07435 [Porphyrobacter sp. IPPAS B-1204]|nr:MAG: hypothetical protein EDM03_07435 [Porphyrobacter sp. IPPAS B-1204]
MELRRNGIDIYYIDESVYHPLSVVSAVRVPFLRPNPTSWDFVWQDYLDKATDWRKRLSREHGIRARAEIHTSEILARRGLFKKNRTNLTWQEGCAFVADAVGTLDFLPPYSVTTAYAAGDAQLMGHKGVKAALFALFQRIRKQCGNHTNGIMFFDDGHPEYIHHYRQATRYMPTGSSMGGWGDGATRNMPLDMFPKDANLKASDKSLFVQIADLAVVTARLKLHQERNELRAKRVRQGHHLLYDQFAKNVRNTAATGKRSDGIVAII